MMLATDYSCYSTPGFFGIVTNILDQEPFCWGCYPVHQRMFDSVPSLYPSDAIYTSCPPVNQRCLQTVINVPWRTKSPPVENQCCKQSGLGPNVTDPKLVAPCKDHK